jgi:deoxyribonuclease-4
VKALEQLDTTVPLLLENTAGGDHAMARHFDVLARLWDHIAPFGVGFCLDTCHAHAAGEDVITSAERILAITGRIDLVHCNDSKDGHGSGRDRHENLGKGTISPEVLAEVVRVANAPCVVETPAEGQADDVAFLKDALSNSA